MKKYVSILSAQAYAVVLAVLHMPRGVTTDEAKYLLNIPYPHPPLLRSLMNATEWMPIQELFWRIIIATLVVQSVWFVWSMARHCTVQQRKFIAGAWLLSAPVLLQAGTIMMAPVTAVQALVFLWLLQQKSFVERYPAYVAIFWLMSLFTAYQIILFVPLVCAVFWQTSLSKSRKILCISLPVFLLMLYTLANPLVPASMVLAGTQNTALSVGQKLEYSLVLWSLGGSVLLSVLGTLGMCVKKQWTLIASLLLVTVYVCLSYRQYYAILYTPLFIGGVLAAPGVLCCLRSRLVFFCMFSVLFVQQYSPSIQASTAKQVSVLLQGTQGIVAIHGAYGHEWQYELRQPVRQYHPEKVEQVAAIVCLDACKNISPHFQPEMVEKVTVWRRQ